MTKARQAVLDILMCAEEPLSAAAVQTASGNTFDPATIYRTLHYLEQKGRAESFVLHCREHGTERYYTAAGEGEHIITGFIVNTVTGLWISVPAESADTRRV